jgi:UDP-N-acetylmuramoyl-L-alanyl-D-glutamate--2,6-diaminopimelate ligase
LPSPDQQARFAAAYSTLKTIAVTGTNGKTTTVSMIAAIVAASGETEAKLTTLGSFIAGERFAAGGPATEFLHTVEAAGAAGVKTFALEVTSKALRSGWAQKWPAHIAVFTNLSRDHLDMHFSAEAYFAAKAQLFLCVADQGQCVLNAADTNAALLAEAIAKDTPIHWYASQSCPEPLALSATGVQSSRAGLTIALADSALARALGGELRLAVVGMVHADNALAAALATHLAGYSASAIVAGLENFAGVPGRFQIVGSDPLTVVDYAHTPDGLRGTLESARGLVAEGGCLRLVFGCGGERDQGKRSEMGRIAHALADDVTITNDNPRREDPMAIAMQIEAGVQGAGARWRICLDREQAVREVIAGARAQDVIVIAGKGHEDTQEVQGESIVMCDVDLARAALKERT